MCGAEEEQNGAVARTSGWQGRLLNSDAAQKDLDKRSGARYLRDHESVCMCVCIACINSWIWG